MRIIPTRTHGVIDCLAGMLLIASPGLFGFADGGVKQWLPVALGVLVIGRRLVANFEIVVVCSLSMSTCLMLGGLKGALLAVRIQSITENLRHRWVPLLLPKCEVLLGADGVLREESSGRRFPNQLALKLCLSHRARWRGYHMQRDPAHARATDELLSEFLRRVRRIADAAQPAMAA